MNGWTMLATAAVALTCWAWAPAPVGTRLRPPPARASTETRAGRSLSGAVLGACAALVVGWLLVPTGWAWLIPVLAIPGGIVGHTIARRMPSAAERLARRRRRADLPAALELMATCLAAGLPLRGAATAVAVAMDDPVRADLARVSHRLDLGVGEREAWLALTELVEWRAVARELARSVESGTGLVEFLHRAAEEARRTHRADQVQRARAVGVRSVWPLMVCYLPAFLLLGIVPIIGSAVLRLLG